MTSHELGFLKPEDTVLDSLPDSVLASLEVRDRWFASLPAGTNGEEFVVDELQKWTPGQTLRVAFSGGNSELHRAIADVVNTISTHCNIKFDFGTGDSFRTWSPDDTQYAAEIRVSFALGGYFSLVGTDSADPAVGLPGQTVGGRPGQCSLNLGGFHIKRPSSWQGTVLHEFLHALAFKHEHTNLNGPCQNDFRWEDDPGYAPTVDSLGRYVNDASGLRPGIYTYLGGYPNSWPRSKVDHNLRPSAGPATSSSFDRASVMLYRFDSLFYKTPTSTCQPSGDGQSLSEQDIRGLQLLYPKADNVDAFAERRRDLIATLDGSRATAGLESAGALSAESEGAAASSVFANRSAAILRASLAHL